MSLPSDNPVLDVRGLDFPATPAPAHAAAPAPTPTSAPTAPTAADAATPGTAADSGFILRQASLAVGEGELVAILGPTGAGKSTLLSCICGDLPAAGAVWLNGKPLHLQPTTRRAAARLKRYGLVPQDAAFLPELTLAQNAALPLLFAGVEPTSAARRARTWLERFELEDFAPLRPAGLPAGVLRRAALARAMVNDPLVLLADEPFAGLTDTELALAGRVLRSVAQSHHTAIVVFTASDSVAALCDRSLLLLSGRLLPGPARTPAFPPPPAPTPLPPRTLAPLASASPTLAPLAAAPASPTPAPLAPASPPPPPTPLTPPAPPTPPTPLAPPVSPTPPAGSLIRGAR